MGKIHAKYLVDEDGDKTAVVLSLEEYHELLEDIHDLASAGKRRASVLPD